LSVLHVQRDTGIVKAVQNSANSGISRLRKDEYAGNCPYMWRVGAACGP
jgi:hypothetical protein